MAKVTAQVAGGDETKVIASTVSELKTLMDATNHSVKVNGETAEDDQQLRDDDFVTLAPQVKAG